MLHAFTSTPRFNSPKRNEKKLSLCCLLAANKQNKWWAKSHLQIPDEFRQVRKSRQQFQPSTHYLSVTTYMHIPFSFAVPLFIYLSIASVHNTHFNVAPIFLLLSPSIQLLYPVFEPISAAVLLQPFILHFSPTLEARSCCWASICCCCLAAISCNSARVISMRGVVTLEEKAHF